MSRQLKGIIGWSILSLLLGIITIIPMVGREIYQYIVFLKPYRKGFEWTDVVVYGIFIAVFSLFHWCVLDILFANCNTLLYW